MRLFRSGWLGTNKQSPSAGISRKRTHYTLPISQIREAILPPAHWVRNICGLLSHRGKGSSLLGVWAPLQGEVESSSQTINISFCFEELSCPPFSSQPYLPHCLCHSPCPTLPLLDLSRVLAHFYLSLFCFQGPSHGTSLSGRMFMWKKRFYFLWSFIKSVFTQFIISSYTQTCLQMGIPLKTPIKHNRATRIKNRVMGLERWLRG